MAKANPTPQFLQLVNRLGDVDHVITDFRSGIELEPDAYLLIGEAERIRRQIMALAPEPYEELLRALLIEKGKGMDEQNNGPAQERTMQQELKPVIQLTTKEIVSEARDLHAHFQQLSEKYEQATPGQRAEIREEMAPLVNRERELREEFNGRLRPELVHDRLPDQQVAYQY